MTIGAVDIGGTKIAVGMVDENGRVLSKMESPTDPERYADGLDRIAAMLRDTGKNLKRRNLRHRDWIDGSGGPHRGGVR